MGKKSHTPPDGVLPVHFAYLDTLNKEGNINMFGAAVYLIGSFPELSTKTARATLRYWMSAFKVGVATK